MILWLDVECIDCGIFDPTYLGIQDFNKDWLIYATAVFL
jgi:hypothetical protein